MSTNYTVIRSDGSAVAFDVDEVEQPNTSTVTFRQGGNIVATFVGFSAFYPTPAASPTTTPAATNTTVATPPQHGNAPTQADPTTTTTAPTTATTGTTPTA